jgi:hypothetical protein
MPLPYPQKITFGEMRASGVRDVLIYRRAAILGLDRRVLTYVTVSFCFKSSFN